MKAPFATFQSARETSAAISGQPKIHKNDFMDRQMIRQFQKTRDPRIQERLVHRHERLVWSIAWRFREAGEPIEDLAQEGFLGLLRAMERYDCSSPAKFSSYAAMKITGNIEHYLRDRSGTIRQPGWVQEMLAKVRRESQRLSQALGRTPSSTELAEAMGETEERISWVMEAINTRSVASLDEPLNGDTEGLSLAEVISDSGAVNLSNMLDDRMDLERAIAGLNETQKQALTLCFYEDMTFEEAGGRMGMDRHRARRVVTRAVRILREQLQVA
jgi:RNA polymerase sigma-B factor